MQQQTEQAAKALREQSRAMRDMLTAANNTAKQIKLITMANREHSNVSTGFVKMLREIRDVTERNARGVKDTRSTTGELVNRAAALTSVTNGTSLHVNGGNGRTNGGNGKR
jgi:methyl-accepting chemotaxis protein